MLLDNYSALRGPGRADPGVWKRCAYHGCCFRFRTDARLVVCNTHADEIEFIAQSRRGEHQATSRPRRDRALPARLAALGAEVA